MKNNTVIWAIDYFIKCEKTDKVLAFNMSKSELINDINKMKVSLETGKYYIYKCLQYYSKQDLIKTDDYVVIV